MLSQDYVDAIVRIDWKSHPLGCAVLELRGSAYMEGVRPRDHHLSDIKS